MVVRQLLCTDDAVATVSFRQSGLVNSQIRLHQLLHEVHLLEVLVRRRGDDVEDCDDVLVSVVSDLSLWQPLFAWSDGTLAHSPEMPQKLDLA